MILQSSDRQLQVELDELKIRSTESERALQEAMQIVDAPTPLALPRMVAVYLLC
jgi:hypothetical protein